MELALWPGPFCYYEEQFKLIVEKVNNHRLKFLCLFLCIRVFSTPMVETPPKNPRVRKLLDELQQWCAQEWGRQSEVARMLGVFPQAVSDWFLGKKQPTGEQVLAIQEFLRAQRRRK